MIKLNENDMLTAIQLNDMQAIKTLVNEAIQMQDLSTSDHKRITAFKTLAKKFSKSKDIHREELKGAFISNEKMTISIITFKMARRMVTNNLLYCIINLFETASSYWFLSTIWRVSIPSNNSPDTLYTPT